LRDQLLKELSDLTTVEEVTVWARRILKAKNNLTNGDAKLVEEAFENKLAELTTSEQNDGGGVSSAPLIAREAEPPSLSVDKSVLPISESRRYRNKAHLKFVILQPCVVCGRRPCDPHHLRFAQKRAMGRKVSDEFTVPLCRTHHRELHRSTNETAWWKVAKIDPLKVARKLWRHTRLDGEAEVRSSDANH
jgi:hypothetical protein